MHCTVHLDPTLLPNTMPTSLVYTRGSVNSRLPSLRVLVAFTASSLSKPLSFLPSTPTPEIRNDPKCGAVGGQVTISSLTSLQDSFNNVRHIPEESIFLPVSSSLPCDHTFRLCNRGPWLPSAVRHLWGHEEEASNFTQFAHSIPGATCRWSGGLPGMIHFQLVVEFNVRLLLRAEEPKERAVPFSQRLVGHLPRPVS